MVDIQTPSLPRGNARESDAVALARRFGLQPVGRRPALTSYITKLWETRHFIRKFAYLRYRSTHHDDLLGAGWNILRPLLQAGVYSLIFGVLLKVAPSSGGPAERVMFITTGVFVFGFTSSCVSSGAKSVTNNLNLIRAMPFARAALPIATVLEEALSTVPAYLALCLISLVTHPPSAAWAVVVPVLFLQLLFNLGVVFVVARITVHLRDFTQLLPFIIRIWFYLSGVFYAVEDRPSLAAHPVIETALTINPPHVFITIMRDALIDGRFADAGYWAMAVAWGVLAALVGFVYFWQAEELYARD